uniref:Putative dna-binding subunit of a dna-dependent protein kinase ku80 autoantigen n=1 Tax=Triatoma infestans TaxID=30076 RepID=A0A023EX66_TRIIF
MATNKVATVVMLDVGLSAKDSSQEETFFDKCKWCLLRIIQRLIFSGENDELAVVLFGCEQTDNALADSAEEDMYDNICEFTPLQKPTWDIYEQVQRLTTSEVKNSNWIECLVVSLNYMKEQTKGKRFKDKQLIVLCNFSMEFECNSEKINLIAESANLDNIKVISMGINVDEECSDKLAYEQLPGTIGLMFQLVEKLEHGCFLSFAEIEEDAVYYERKRKMARFSKVNICIGSKISIPVRWIKINLDPTRIKWGRKPVYTELTKPVNNEGMRDIETKNEPEIRYVMETQKVTKFGNSEVVLNYADLFAMKRQTGPPSCILLGCVKSHRITRKMIVGKDIYLVVPERSPRAQRMLSAFVDALISADKYALIRRVTTQNGKIKLGVLVPVSDEVGKELYFLQLPFAEHAMVVPDVMLPEPNNSEILSTFDNLIDSMLITDKPKDLPMKDPTFQLRCHILHLCQTEQLENESEDPPLPDFIKKLCDPYPELRENAVSHVKKLEEMLPITIDESLLESLQISENKVSLNEPADLIQKESSSSNIKKQDSANKIDVEMDWEEAETQEWPEEVKEKYQNLSKKEIPSIIIKEEMLSKNKYDTEYISGNIWKKYGSKDEVAQSSPKKVDTVRTEENSAIQELIQGRHSTGVEIDTGEMLERFKTNLDRK